MADRVESEDLEGRAANATATAAETARVFVSYASPDAAVAGALVESLEGHGIPCWIAPRDVTPGALYADAIVRAISGAKALILVLSESAIGSSHVGKEVERASSKKRPIIALRIDNAPLTPALEYFLSESQWVEAQGESKESAYARLIGAIREPRAAAPGISLPVTSSFGRAPAANSKPRRNRMLFAAGVAIVVVAFGALLADKFWLAKHVATEQPTTAATNVVKDKSIAVLPFADMSEKKDQEYFADGMAEEILNLLAKVPGLKVIGRTSSFQFKGHSEDLRAIGEKLGAKYAVEGSVRKAESRIRVTAQLIDTTSGSHIWSDTYDRDFGDVLALQDDIATGIARSLELAVSGDNLQSRRRLHSDEAYTLYLQGLSALDRQHPDQLNRAKTAIEQALALDPSFVRAAEALALTYIAIGWDTDIPAREAWEQAQASAERVLRIDNRSASAHSVLGFVLAYDDFNWSAAEEEFRRALALNPREATTLYLAAQVSAARGRYSEALQRMNSSIALDPLNPWAQQMLGFILVDSGDSAGAEAAFRKSLAISPTFDGSHLSIALIRLSHGLPEEALKELQTEPASDAKDAGLALVYHSLGRDAKSNAALERLTRVDAGLWPYAIGVVYTYRGQLDDAFAWMDKAYALRDADFILNNQGAPLLAPLRDDPRYKLLLRKMNLPE